MIRLVILFVGLRGVVPNVVVVIIVMVILLYDLRFLEDLVATNQSDYSVLWKLFKEVVLL
jgi:hypothetical protein